MNNDTTNPQESRLRANVRAFHKAFGAPTAETPGVPSDERVRLRLRLIAEEFFELLDSTLSVDLGAVHGEIMSEIDAAPLDVNIDNVADDLADLRYVIAGTDLEFGIDGDAIDEVVHASNMAKLGPDGKPTVREDGKVIKPHGWKAAGHRGGAHEARVDALSWPYPPSDHAAPDTEPAPEAGFTTEDFCPRGCARKLVPSHYKADALHCGQCGEYAPRRKT